MVSFVCVFRCHHQIQLQQKGNIELCRYWRKQEKKTISTKMAEVRIDFWIHTILIYWWFSVCSPIFETNDKPKSKTNQTHTIFIGFLHRIDRLVNISTSYCVWNINPCELALAHNMRLNITVPFYTLLHCNIYSIT